MATGLRNKRWAATAVAPLLLLAACGEKEEPAAPQDAGSDADDAPSVSGLESLLASLGDDVAGSPCVQDEECEGTNARCSRGAPGTVRTCTGLCTSDDHCGRNGTCVEVARLGAETLSFCQKLCASDDECDAQLQCSRAFNVYGVLRGISDRLRGADVFADEGTPTVCQEKPETVMIEDGAVGRACSEGCPGGSCDALPAAFTPGGYCSGKCLRDEQCGENGACVQDVATLTLGLPGMCLLRCTDRTECREGYGCWALPWVLSDTRYCVPDQFLRDRPPPPMPGDADAGGS
jgi:hypothetical protein